jgi:hypothetical protein
MLQLRHSTSTGEGFGLLIANVEPTVTVESDGVPVKVSEKLALSFTMTLSNSILPVLTARLSTLPRATPKVVDLNSSNSEIVKFRRLNSKINQLRGVDRQSGHIGIVELDVAQRNSAGSPSAPAGLTI